MPAMMMGLIGGESIRSAVATITWDAAKKAANITLSNGNLTGSLATTTIYAGMLGSGSGRSTGKYYFELTITALIPDGQGVGFGNASTDLSAIGGGTQDSVQWRANGQVRSFNSPLTGSPIQTFAAGDILAIAVDFTAGLAWFRSNNSTNWNNNGSADPATGVGGFNINENSLNAGPYFPMTTLEINGDTFTANFGATAYTLTAPSGFGNW